MNVSEESSVLLLKNGQDLTDLAKSKSSSAVPPSGETAKDANFKKRCDRTVYRNKYERNSPEITSWWHHLFALLEDDAAIPIDQQPALIRETVRFTLYNRLRKILNFRERSFKEDPTVSEEDLLKLPSGAPTARRAVFDAASDKRVILTNESVAALDDLQKAAEELGGWVKHGISEHVMRSTQEVPESKMYTDFFKRKRSRAAVWRTPPPLSLLEMDLDQKAEIMTEQIATDFIDWLRDMEDGEEPFLSAEYIIEMFDLGFLPNCATSLKVHVKEMPSLPRKVAAAMGMPKKAKRSILHGEIARDLQASKKKIRYTAFGRRLPTHMQVRPPAENYFRKWLSCDKVPEKLTSMAAVWQGITHLKSTRAYCEYLIEEKPDIKPPKFLADCGLTDIKNLQNSDEVSINTSGVQSMLSA